MVRRSALPDYIVEVLSERYPRRVVPQGTWTALSQELGISRVYIGSVAARNGWRVEERRDTRQVADVRAAALERLKQFPSGEVPSGLYASLAREFGVSRQYVRRVAAEAGWSVSASRSRSAFPCQ